MLSIVSASLAEEQPVAVEREKAIEQALANLEQEKVSTKVSPTWEEANADKPYIGLLTEYDVKINEDWSYEETYHTRVKVQKEVAKELGQWPIYYNKSREKVLEVKAYLETPDGKRLEATNVQDLSVYDDSPMYSDMRVKTVTLPQVNVGSVIDIAVKSKITHKEIPNQFWDQVEYPVFPTKYARYSYTFPENKPIQFHAYKNDAQPNIVKKDGLVTYAFVFTHTEYTQDEELMPPMDEVAGVLSLSSLADWKQVADWYRELINKNTVEDEGISAKALELTKDKTTQKDKARAILEFIQDNFRYVPMSLGDHTVEPHQTNGVFQNRYGDCKDLSLLTRQMLKAAGVESNICLFSGEFNGNPQNGLPNPGAFDHVILEVMVDGEKYFVDPQTKGFDFGQLPSDYDNASVMVIDDLGYRFDQLPLGTEAERSVVSVSDITIAPDGSAVFEVDAKLPLEASQSFRQNWASTTEQDKNKFFESLEANFSEGGKMLAKEIKGVEDRYGPVSFKLKYDSPAAYPIVNNMILLKEVDHNDIPDFSSKDRKFPLFIPNNSLIKNTNTYHIPAGYVIDFLPADYDLGIDFLDVSMHYTKGDAQVVVDGVSRMKRATVSSSRYEEVKAFRNELYKKNDQYIVLKKTNVSSEAKDWIQKQ